MCDHIIRKIPNKWEQRKFKCIIVGSGAAYTGNTIQVNVYYVKV